MTIQKVICNIDGMLMHRAAFFVATNPNTHGRGFYPVCGGIEKISGRKPSYVGKPSRGLSARR